MSSVIVCNVCRVPNCVKMYFIIDAELREAYRKVTNMVYTDQEPLILCFICRSQLKRINSFFEMSCKTEQIITELSSRGIQITDTIAMMLGFGVGKHLTCTINPILSIDSEIYVEPDGEAEKFIEIAIDTTPFKTSVCRVCLTVNVKAYCIKDTGLQDIFENVTGITLSDEDGRPGTICYICLPQLEQCFKFFLLSSTAREETVGGMIRTDDLFFHLKNIHNLAMGPPQLTYFEEQVSAINEEYKDTTVSEVAITKPEDNNQNNTGLENVPYNQCNNVLIESQQADHNDTQSSVTFTCDTCKVPCKSKQVLIKHLRLHGFGKPWKCSQCPKVFNSYGYMNAHKNKVHFKERKYKCSDCGKAFHTNLELKGHILKHAGIKPHVCNTCGKSFTMKATLTRHELIHSDKKPYECDVCSKGFNDRSVMLRHKKKTNCGSVKQIECNQCGMTFSLQHNLETHMKQHTGIKPYSCSVCSKPFAEKKALKLHMPFCKYFKCKECGSTFTDKASVLKHIKEHRVNSSGKGGTCKICHEFFINLRNHTKIHSDVKSHICRFCDKAFLCRRNKERHERNLHEQPCIPCPLCNQTFTRQKVLYSHIKAHKSKKLHVCSFCGLIFYMEMTLQSHLKLFHKQGVDTKTQPPPREVTRKNAENIDDPPTSYIEENNNEDASVSYIAENNKLDASVPDIEENNSEDTSDYDSDIEKSNNDDTSDSDFDGKLIINETSDSYIKENININMSNSYSVTE